MFISKIALTDVGFRLKGGIPSGEPLRFEKVTFIDVINSTASSCRTIDGVRVTLQKRLKAALQEQNDRANCEEPVSANIAAFSALEREALMNALKVIDSLNSATVESR